MRIRLDWFGEKLAQRLADLEAGRITPAVPRDAATVMLLRSAEAGTGAGVEVLMLRRVAAMKFAPGAYVFPGGSVDPADYDAPVGWHGPDPAEFGARLGASAEMARALVCAAVRETFEEAGVLLAGAPDGGPVADPSGSSWEADRAALVAGDVTLAELLSRRGLVLRADLLVPWARWITPEGEPRRFDARFFAAALPAGQVATGHAAESDRIEWLRPADVSRLFAAVQEVFADSLSAGGTTFDSLYVNVNGQSGYFERSLAVYGRAGQPCRRCGTTVRRDPFMNRSAFSCPKCQPRPRTRT